MTEHPFNCDRRIFVHFRLDRISLLPFFDISSYIGVNCVHGKVCLFIGWLCFGVSIWFGKQYRHEWDD